MGDAAVGVLWAMWLAVVPLTEPQRLQLDAATDFGRQVDEAALYPLLHNAWQWQGNEEAGATIPDFRAIRAAPAEHRGKLFLIEGLFAGVPRGGSLLAGRLSRAGPWDETLQRWVIVVDRAVDEVAVVYMVRPPAAPAAGAGVRLVGRFYKVWSDQDLHGQPTDFLTFVGNTAVLARRDRPIGLPTGGAAMLVALLVLTGSWYVLRRTLRAKPLRMRARLRDRMLTSGDDDHDAVDVPLPRDPAEALQALQQLHQDSE